MMDGAGTQRIIEQVRRCPSGALSYYMNDGNTEANTSQPDVVSEAAEILNIRVTPNGPILITTDCRIQHSNGQEEINREPLLCAGAVPQTTNRIVMACTGKLVLLVSPLNNFRFIVPVFDQPLQHFVTLVALYQCFLVFHASTGTTEIF